MSQIPFGSKVLFDEAEKRGFNPAWETKFGLFSIQTRGKTIYFFSTKLSINSSLGSYITKDKYTTRVILERNNFPNIPYLFTNNLKELHYFFDHNQPIVAKPVMGERSQNTVLIEERDKVEKFVLPETLFEKYIPGTEFRYLVLKGEVIAVQSKTLEPVPEYPWRKHIANHKPKDYNKECVRLAIKIADLIGLQFLAVDFMQDMQGKFWVLELNSAPGLYSLYNPDTGEAIKIGPLLFDTIIGGRLL